MTSERRSSDYDSGGASTARLAHIVRHSAAGHHPRSGQYALQRNTPSKLPDQSIAQAWPAAAHALPAESMLGLTDSERYFFDTQGFVVIPGVLAREQVNACNAALERNRDLIEYTPLSEDGRGWVVPEPLAGTSLTRPGRSQLSNVMQLAPPHRQIFREIFVLDKVLGCMQDLLGLGFRGTDGRILLTASGAEGHALHSGGTTRDADEEASTLGLGGHMYLCQNGRIWNTMMSVQFALSDVRLGDGGFAALPGSHKSNFECPWPVRNCAPGALMPGQLGKKLLSRFCAHY
eukprot:SAG31_NODE_351_length_17237_cov_7.010445_17_plen_290_part_00